MSNSFLENVWNYSVQSLSHIRLFETPGTAACQACRSITNSWSLLKLMSIESVMPSNHLTFCHPLLPPSIFPSIRVFSSESVLRIWWPKYWSFSFSISPSNEYSGLISFRMDWLDWLDLLAGQGTLKSLLQHHSSKASILQCSAFFIVQLSHPSSQWCHPTISSSVIPFSHLQSFPASGSFPMSQFFTSGGQNVAACYYLVYYFWITSSLWEC